MGYQVGVKGYRLLSTETNKILISRDVIFNELDFPFKRNEKGSVSVSDVSGNRLPNKTGVQIEVEPSSIELNEQENFEPEIETETQEEDLSNYQLARDRTRRDVKAPERYIEADIIAYALHIANQSTEPEPRSYSEAINSRDSQKWKQAMMKELKSLKENNTWELVLKPERQKIIDCKWVFKVKEGITEKEPKVYKARLVAKGFTQVEGVDYSEIFSPVVKMKTIRIMLALAVQFEWSIEQMDVKTAFLNGQLEETIFMSQPEGFKVESKRGELVCLLKKSLYGLKQSPRQWYKKFNSVVTKVGYTRSKYDTCLYFSELDTSSAVFLLIYVDDMLIMSKDMQQIIRLKNVLKSEFEMKDLGAARKILGIDIIRDRNARKLMLTQEGYLKKVIQKFKMSDSKEVNVPLAGHFNFSTDQSPKTDQEVTEMKEVPYPEAIGSVMYSMISTRPDIAHAMSVLSRYMSTPGVEHWKGLKWLLRYLKATTRVGL